MIERIKAALTDAHNPDKKQLDTTTLAEFLTKAPDALKSEIENLKQEKAILEEELKENIQLPAKSTIMRAELNLKIAKEALETEAESCLAAATKAALQAITEKNRKDFVAAVNIGSRLEKGEYGGLTCMAAHVKAVEYAELTLQRLQNSVDSMTQERQRRIKSIERQIDASQFVIDAISAQSPKKA